MVRKIFTAKDLRYSKVRHSAAMSKIMADPRMAKILNKPKERKQLLKAIKEHGGSRQGVREALGELYYGSDDALSKQEVRVLKRGIGGGVLRHRKLVVPKEDKINKETDVPRENSDINSEKTSASASDKIKSKNQDRIKIQPSASESSRVPGSSSAKNYASQNNEKQDNEPKNIWTMLNKINR